MRVNHLRRRPSIPHLSTTSRTSPVCHSIQQIRLISHQTSQLPFYSSQLPSRSIRIWPSTLNSTPLRTLSSTIPHNQAMTETVEDAKRAAAQQAVKEHFDPKATYVGIGSGTTVVYVVDAIKERSTNPDIKFVPTGAQSHQLVVKAGLTPIAYNELPDDVMLEVAFDGADEVDEDLNCIKGGGACLFQEKLVAQRAKKFVCVADYRKKQPRLLTNWPTIPIEVCPLSVNIVLRTLKTLGSKEPKLRTTKNSDTQPLKTDQDFFIIDAPFPTLLTSSDVAAGKGKGDGTDGSWEVNKLSQAIKTLTGVLEVGIFSGLDGPEAEALRQQNNTEVVYGGQKPVAVYFGMQDGGVEKRTAKTAS